jgi:glycosyltransferase involved in cell wall biosynthesis
MPLLNLEPMQLLITIPAIGSVYGGPSKSVRELAQELGRQGAMVDLVTTNANGTEKLDVPLQTWLEEHHYRLQYFSCHVWGDYKWSPPLATWVGQNLKNYDAVHLNAIFSLTNLPFYWHCRRQRIPFIIAPRGMLEPWALAYKAHKKRLYYHLLERPALNHASAIHTLASTEADKITSLGLKPPTVIIPNGIHRQNFATPGDPALFYQQFPHTQGKTLILFLGRLDPKKGLDLLAPAFAQVQAKFPHTHLAIAGPDNVNFLPTAQRYFAETYCDSAVTFTGMLTGDLKQAALAAADVYVAPSYSEGFSMSVLEAMASGLPCIITTGCNFPEAAQANAAKVVDIQADAIADALIECLSDPSAAKVMGDRARQFVLNNYTWDKVAAQLIEVYQAILQQAPLP